jgi:hypothetical protein
VSAVSFSLKGSGWFGDGYGAKAESADSEGDTSAGAGATTEVVSTDAAPAETTAPPATQSSAPTQMETKNTAATVVPTTIKDKADVSPIVDRNKTSNSL